MSTFGNTASVSDCWLLLKSFDQKTNVNNHQTEDNTHHHFAMKFLRKISTDHFDWF